MLELPAPQPWVEPHRRRWVRRRCEPRAAPIDLEARLVAAVRAPAALRRALARVAGRMVAVRGWERLGCARPSDYAVERVGISGRELRDLAAVGQALAELPALDAAFCAGEIGWTQLRLLCRVATPEDEKGWLALASQLTARELAREVRKVDRRACEPLDAGGDGEKRVAVVMRLTSRARARWWSARQVANRVAGYSLSHAGFAEVLAAEVLSGVPLDGTTEPPTNLADDASEGSESRDPPLATRSGWRGSPARPDAEVAALEQDLESADPFELDRRLRLAVQMEARGLARIASLLSGVVAWGLHCDLGFASLDAYAVERLGMAASRARALLRIERGARECPLLRAAFAEGQISWVQAHALVPLLLEPGAARHREAWIAHAQRVTVRRLCDDVERALALRELAPPPLDSSDHGIDSDADPAGLQTGAILRLETRANASSSLPSPRSRSCSAPFSPPCSDGSSASAAAPAGKATRSKRCSTTRSQPGVRRNAHAAITVCSSATAGAARHRAARPTRTCTATTSCSARTEAPISNLTTLCAWHHERGVHGYILRCTGVAPDGLRFELGLRSDGPPLAVYRSGDIVMT